jgi:predicted peptidase
MAPASPIGSKAPAGAPGETLVFEFPDLPKDKKDAVAALKVRLPSQYDPAKPMPLLLWFSGGEGGNDPNGGLPLVDEATWAVAAMPYPTNATTPRNAMRDGGMKIIREYHATMLKKLIAALPNIDPKLRFVGGFSNGAHCTGTYLAEGERDFIDYFRGYIIIEGGGIGQKAKKTLRNSFAYLAWGDAEGNTQAFMGSIVAAVKDGRLKATTHGMKGVGHGFPGAEQAEVKKWIETVAVPGILAIKP